MDERWYLVPELRFARKIDDGPGVCRLGKKAQSGIVYTTYNDEPHIYDCFASMRRGWFYCRSSNEVGAPEVESAGQNVT